jgi:hypothetical protein
MFQPICGNLAPTASLKNAGRKPASVSTVVPGRMISSVVNPAIGANSLSNEPSFVARAAFSWLPAENSSSSVRDRPHFAAISSALMP